MFLIVIVCVSTEYVYGALLGTQKGRSVEICNSFELVVTSVDEAIVLDREYFSEKEEQCEWISCIHRYVRLPQFARCSQAWSSWAGTQ